MAIRKAKNEDFFKKWSPEMSYVLGFFTADGSMAKNVRGGHYIEFYTTDRDLLYNIRRALASTNSIGVRDRARQNPKWKMAYRLQIGSKVMFKDLLHLGLTPNKSRVVQFPKMPSRYLADFVRGYFDGDGNVTVSTFVRRNRNNRLNTTILSGFVSGSRIFLEKLHAQLIKFGGIVGGTLYHGSRAHRLYFSVNDSRALYRFMYKNNATPLSLERKKRIFEKYFKIA